MCYEGLPKELKPFNRSFAQLRNFDVHSIGSFSKARLKRAGRKRIEHFSFSLPAFQLLFGLGNLFLLRKRDSIEILGHTPTWNEDTNVNSVNYSF